MAQVVCLIGGGGFVGTAVRETLRARGEAVVIVGRSPGFEPAANERYFSWTGQDREALHTALSACGISAVIDFSHASNPNPRAGQLIDELTGNLTSLTANLDLARAVGARRYLFVSSGGTVYGDAGQVPVSEVRAAAPISSYGVTKLTSERLVSMAQRSHGLDVVIARPANVYGPGQWPFRGQGVIATALGSAIRHSPVTIFGSGSAVRDYLFRTDCAAGLLAILDQGKAGEIYNLGSGDGLDLLTLIDTITDLVALDGFELERQYAPGNPNEVPYNVLDCAKLRAAGGWRPEVTLQSGLEQSWEWIRSVIEP